MSNESLNQFSDMQIIHPVEQYYLTSDFEDRDYICDSNEDEDDFDEDDFCDSDDLSNGKDEEVEQQLDVVMKGNHVVEDGIPSHFEEDLENPILKLGSKFNNVDEFRLALRQYCIIQVCEVNYIKS